MTVLACGTHLSPDAGRLFGIKGFVDFLSDFNWAIELMQDGKDTSGHIERCALGDAFR